MEDDNDIANTSEEGAEETAILSARSERIFNISLVIGVAAVVCLEIRGFFGYEPGDFQEVAKAALMIGYLPGMLLMMCLLPYTAFQGGPPPIPLMRGVIVWLLRVMIVFACIGAVLGPAALIASFL